jgi:hypothetical protein
MAQPGAFAFTAECPAQACEKSGVMAAVGRGKRMAGDRDEAGQVAGAVVAGGQGGLFVRWVV